MNSVPDARDPGRTRPMALLLLVHGALAAALVTVWLRRDPTPASTLYWDDAVRRDVQSIVEYRYLEPVDASRARDLFNAALDGYVQRLDPFSRYFPAEEYRRLEEDTRGSFGGIGVRILRDGAGLRVTAIRLDGPAAHAGIAPGELLLAADGEQLADHDVSELVERIKGEPGSPVVLTVEDPAGGRRDVTVTRRMVEVETVPSVRLLEGDPPVLYVRVSQFAETTPDELARALRGRLEADGTAVLLDLRQNLGGVVRGAVRVAGMFLPPGSLVCTTRGRDAEARYVTPDDPPVRAFEVPLVALVDAETASASELLAGALQDHGRAALVGTATFGKFLVQTIVPLGGEDGAVRVTTSRYETPRGRSAQRNPDAGVRGGLTPDVCVQLPSAQAREDLLLAFADQLGPDWRGLPGDDTAAPPADAQMQVALDLLRGAPAPAEYVPAAR